MASSEFDKLLQHLVHVFKIRPQVLLMQTDEYICSTYTGPDGTLMSPSIVPMLKAYIQSPQFKNRVEFIVTVKPSPAQAPPNVHVISNTQPRNPPRFAQVAPGFPLPPKVASSSLFCARKIAAQLAKMSSNLDICFCIDGTGSMAPHIARVKESIIRVSNELEMRTGMIARFALVVYRDYGDGVLRKEVHQFSNCTGFQTTLSRVKTTGGGDTPEDCFGGLWAAAAEVQWEAPARIIIWMGDAPQHGPAYFDGPGDNHPNEPDTPTSAKIFKALHDKHIILVFCKLTSLTDRMIAQMKEETKEFGANRFLERSMQGDVGEFLTNVLHSTVSMTMSHGVNKPGPLKICKITPATWDINNLWGPEEDVIIITSVPYEYGRHHPLLDMITADQAIKDRPAKCRFTLQPVEHGEMRIAYRARITENDSALPQLFGMAKESRYEGSHNCSENLKNQAKIQAVAAFLAAEFTIKLRKIQPEYGCCGVEYIPVEILRLPNRPEGKRYLSYETFLPGEYLKFNGNNGFVDKVLEMQNWLPQTFSHFTYIYSSGMLLVSDLQGVIFSDGTSRIHRLTDPAVHTANADFLEDPTNLGARGIQAFFSSHVCNRICQEMELPACKDADTDKGLDETDVIEAIQVIRNFTPTFHP